jgi:hypothetical protein
MKTEAEQKAYQEGYKAGLIAGIREAKGIVDEEVKKSQRIRGYYTERCRHGNRAYDCRSCEGDNI